MLDFYKLAAELRKELAALFPKGYTKIIETDTGVTVKIINFNAESLRVDGVLVIEE